MDTKNFCALAHQLILESRRSTQTDTLLKYNDVLVRAITREQRLLERSAEALEGTSPPPPSLLIIQTAINRNKRCLLAYHTHRLDRLRDMYWASACSLPFLLSDPVTRSKLSPHEVDFLKAYAAMTIEFRSQFEGDVDITSSIEDIPRDLHVWVKVKRPDCGVIETENGRIDFRMGQRYLVSKSDVEHLVAQGYLEIVD